MRNESEEKDNKATPTCCDYLLPSRYERDENEIKKKFKPQDYVEQYRAHNHCATLVAYSSIEIFLEISLSKVKICSD